MEELAAQSTDLHFQIYPKEERLASWDKDTVWLKYFPAPRSAPCQPYLLILPGGGWNRQWGFIEGQAIAARANALGYPAFVLYYRVKQEPVGLLSGGQRQALTLLMATYHIPKLLLLDEHTAALDPGTAEKVLALTRSIVEENKSPASRSPTTCSPPWIWATAR